MTQNMESMDFSDDDEPDEDAVVGYLELMPPYHSKLGWHTMEIKDGEEDHAHTFHTHPYVWNK